MEFINTNHPIQRKVYLQLSEVKRRIKKWKKQWWNKHRQFAKQETLKFQQNNRRLIHNTL